MQRCAPARVQLRCAAPLRAARQRLRRAAATAASASAAPLRVHIQSVLDPACPWCFIGLRRLQRALDASPDVEATLRYVPYVFDPATPTPPLTWRAYVALRYPDRADAIYTQKLPYTLAQAASEGIQLHRYDERPMGPTVDALCVLKAAQDAGRADEYVEQILSQHFERGRDTSDAGVLLDCAAAAGISAAAASAALAPASEARAWVAAEDARARTQLRVGGVPHYALSLGAEPEVIVSALEGAQPPYAWAAAFTELRRRAGRP